MPSKAGSTSGANPRSLKLEATPTDCVLAFILAVLTVDNF
jgi:hypothetical protein